ncbi:MAG: capsule assembly Wzi family protein [Spirochaetia bacterium]|nr:capsule assembly Wzi family protein [Spirochaetia bacterium]
MILFLVTVTIGAENLQNIIPLGSSVYGDLDIVYLDAGYHLPSTSRPWSYGEAQQLLDRVDRSSLSTPAAVLYDTLYEELFTTDLRFSLDDDYQLGVGMILSGEAYYHTNEDDFDLEGDWIYGYAQRSPLMRLSLDIAMHDWFYTYCDLAYQKNRFASEDDDLYDPEAVQPMVSSFLYKDTFSTNYFSMKHVDFETPYRAFVSAGSDGWNLQFGRDLYSWGPGNTGNFVISDNLDFYDAFRFVSYHEHFKYEILYAFFDYAAWDDEADEYPTNEHASNGVEMMLAHRLEFSPLHWLSFAISENVMYEHSFIDLRYLNPAYIFHNLNNRDMFNAIAYAEVNMTPLPGLNIYGQFVIDQARAPLEGNSQPGAFGYMLGGTYVNPAGAGLLRTNLELVYTDPYLYQRDGVDFKVDQRHFIIDSEHYISQYVAFMGYSTGGDTIAAELSSEYREAGLGTFSVTVQTGLHGEVTLDTVIGSTDDFTNAGDRAPSGDVITQDLVISTAGQLELPSFERLGLWYEIDWLLRRTYTRSTELYSDLEQDLQCVLGVSVSL